MCIRDRRKEVLRQLQNGEIDIVIGTHALLSEGVAFFHLGLVITDEQHRFGVGQRAALAAKGNHPHLLVMSATPIPRTLALMVYGDLDVSILDELPPGRQPVDTFWINSGKRQRAFRFIKNHLDAGRQAYIVCPLVEEGESNLAAAQQYFDQLQSSDFSGYSVGLLHGKMKSREKERPGIIKPFDTNVKQHQYGCGSNCLLYTSHTIIRGLLKKLLPATLLTTYSSIFWVIV